MRKLNSKGFIDKMNQWGGEARPFIFIIDFEMKNPVVLPLEEAAANGIYFTFDNQNKVLPAPEGEERMNIRPRRWSVSAPLTYPRPLQERG